MKKYIDGYIKRECIKYFKNPTKYNNYFIPFLLDGDKGNNYIKTRLTLLEDNNDD